MSRAIRERQVRCADCSVLMQLRGKSRMRYSCPKCSASLVADIHGRLRGVPGTKEDRRWRRKAHLSFDRLCRSGDITRSAGQRWLARKLGIPNQQFHFSYMRVETLRHVVDLCDDVREGRGWGPTAINGDEDTSKNRRLANEALRLLRRTGAHPIATRHWLSHHVGIPAFVDVGGLSSKECQRLVQVVARAFAGEIKLPRHGRMNKRLRLEWLGRNLTSFVDRRSRLAVDIATSRFSVGESSASASQLRAHDTPTLRS